jgi:hypothetical protein
MEDWRRICEELIEAGEKATVRPWWDHVGGVRGGDGDGDGVIGAIDDSIHIGSDDKIYLLLAANNADRLARFVLLLAEGHGYVACMTAEQQAASLHRLWSETINPVSELSNLGEPVKMPTPKGGGSVRG